MLEPLLSADSRRNYTAWGRFAAEAEGELRRFETALHDPREAQERRLRAILSTNAATRFGHEHGFSAIESIRGFRRSVPESSWASVAPWIERIRAGERDVLTAEEPLHLERTSGSGAQRKHIPYTRALLREFQSALVVWLASLVRDCPDVDGPSYWSLSPSFAPPETTAGGIPVGSAGDAIYLAGSAAEQLLSTVVGAAALSAVSAGDDWQLETVHALAAEPDLRLLSVWSPTFLQALLDVVLDEARRAASMAQLEARLPRERYTALASAVECRDFTALWPRLALLSCWTDGPSAAFAPQLERLFPGVRVAPKGLFATEGVVSVPFGSNGERPVAITSHFLEFVDDDGAPRIVNELEAGKRYRPLLTTSGGLYRYRLGDVVEVTGFVARTPCLRFVGREDHRSDLVGEKLDETIVAAALRAAGVTSPAVLVPDASARPPRYRLIVEPAALRAKHAENAESVERIATAVDQELCRAHHYALARRNGQLGAVTSAAVDNLAALLHTAWQADGRRSGDAKPAALVAASGFAAALVATLRDTASSATAAGR